MKKTILFSAIVAVFFIVSAACVTGSPAESVRRYAALTETAAAKPTATVRPFVEPEPELCPPLGYDRLTAAEITIDDQLAATLKYENRLLTVTSALGIWTSEELGDSDYKMEFKLELQDGRKYSMTIFGVVCDGLMYIEPPEIAPQPDSTSASLDQAISRPAPTFQLGDPCTLSFVVCPTPTTTGGVK